MGKLNYSARRITGVKAAQVVSKDLRKRIPPGIHSKAAARDPTLEIDVSGKELANEGLAQFIDDLIECSKYRDADHTEGLAKVTEIHLSGNKLTAQSLVKLGDVVALNSGELREFDLSNNDIQINTPEEKESWYKFLNSFSNCYMLKKLDLGSNPLGPAGMEILARVYIKSDLDFLEDDADIIIGPKSDEEEVLADGIEALKIKAGKDHDGQKSGCCKKSPHKGKFLKQSSRIHVVSATAKANTPTELKRFACTRGLRSIPYLILSNTSITNGGAVHLASMLEIQRTPEQLLAFLPAGKILALPDTAQSCKGIIWKENGNLVPYAKRLLEVAEVVRDYKAISNSDEESLDGEEDLDGTNGQNNDHHHNNHKMDTIMQWKMQNKTDIEFTRLAKRVRMEALKTEGIHSMDIWITALRMILVSRALLLEDKDRMGDTPSEDETLPAEVEEEPSEESAEEMLVEEPVDNDIAEPFSDPVEPAELNMLHMPSGPFHPAAESFEADFPALQSVSNGKNEVAPETKCNSPLFPPVQATRSGKGHPRATGGTRSPCKNMWRYGLPFELWRRIIADAVGAHDILDLQQQERIMRYASDWNTFSYEMTITGAEHHQQIWKILETVNCFTYSPLE
ncbi:hypothetical protein EYZ11_009638 [Aspergillus tanneri]|uniref:Uncharacterized protein n=1 Tax=Aspergillus tanneri TaxID=1220188 RepID=A0A4S3J7E7_9EURO|nr:uncharacterized protein ATNIH1004_002411 [Aspergillus tanneri]KAA8649737.1 hypothetical protein ATNIH1004_002411 [Aspergillus tanneri]THC90899.1 hypothetical protein EYZ11_009638 [Aspergillus tanneri]